VLAELNIRRKTGTIETYLSQFAPAVAFSRNLFDYSKEAVRSCSWSYACKSFLTYPESLYPQAARVSFTMMLFNRSSIIASLIYHEGGVHGVSSSDGCVSFSILTTVA
jgi:hypothetical protein